MLEINEIRKEVKLNLEIHEGVGLFIDNSGSGKTFSFKFLKDYCEDNYIDFIYLNYDIYKTKPEDIINICKDKTLVMFDNADLYLKPDIVDKIYNLGVKYILVSIKSSLKLTGLKVRPFNYSIKSCSTPKSITIWRS